MGQEDITVGDFRKAIEKAYKEGSLNDDYTLQTGLALLMKYALEFANERLK